MQPRLKKVHVFSDTFLVIIITVIVQKLQNICYMSISTCSINKFQLIYPCTIRLVPSQLITRRVGSCNHLHLSKIYMMTQHKGNYDQQQQTMNYGQHEIIEVIAHYYQSNFNMSNIVAQLSNYDDVLNKHVKAKRITGNVIFVLVMHERSTKRTLV